MDLALDDSYETCRRMHRRHDPTYYWATRRLPAEIRPATHALYGYVRTADEIVDGPRRPASAEARRAALDAWERELEHGRAAGRSPHPVVGALVDAGRRHGLPLDELAHLHALDADRLRARCGSRPGRSWRPTWTARPARSAASWRRCSACPSAITPGYGRLGQAFQLTNFIRDVREDTSLDRVYLPAEDRARFGVAEDELAREHASPELRALLALEVRRARGAVRRGRAGDRGGARPPYARVCASRSPSTSACSTGSSGSTSTCSAGAPACARGSSPGAALGALRR